MLRGDGSGRVPFALVAVFLLVSAGASAMYAAKRAHDEADARAREARLAALNAVADDVHREVLAQAQYVAIQAIAEGTDGLVNASKVNDAFRTGFAEYVASHFPRTVRGVAVSISAFEDGLGLVQRRLADAVPSNATRSEFVDGVPIETPDLSAPEDVVPVDRLAYFDIRGLVNYTLTLDGVTLFRPAPLVTLVPVPAPLMETKLEQVARSGEGDLTGIGRTVKAILATVVQFRIFDGVASPARPLTTTRDVLTREDVELAVNLAILLEEIRRFHAYDRDAARAVDAARGPPSPERGLVRLLDRYAANGTLDATDLYALYTGLDLRGVSMGSLLAQAIVTIEDELSLKAIDYLGLTPLADWLNGAIETLSNWVDGFWSWATNQPDAPARYVLQFVRAVFLDTGVGTAFMGPLDFPLPARVYPIPNGTGQVAITVPAHAATIGFPPADLTSSGMNQVWDEYFPRLQSRVAAVDASLRSLANDIATRIAKDTVLAGLLPPFVAGAIDPKDNASFLDALGARVAAAVDVALARLRTDPYAIEAMMENLWNATKALLEDLVSFLVGAYDAFLRLGSIVFDPAKAFRYDLWAGAALDPQYRSLNQTQRTLLTDAIATDVDQNGWADAARVARRENDTAKWRHALDLADRTTLPGANLQGQILIRVLGSAGWLETAGGVVERLVAQAVGAQDLAATRAVYRTSDAPFTLSDPWTGSPNFTEGFRVHHTFEGPLAFGISDPAGVPAGDATPNVHYTNPWAPSLRPFTTQWTVEVSGAVRLRVETASPVLLGPHGLEPAALEATWPLEFTLDIPAYSGWNLAGVSYRSSDTLPSQIVGFLVSGFDSLAQILRWAAGVLRKSLEILRDFVGQLYDFVTKVVRVLSNVFSHFLDILRAIAVGALRVVGDLLDRARGIWGDVRPPPFTVQVAGMRLSVDLFGPNGRSLVLGFDLLGAGRVEFVHLPESEFWTPAYRARLPPGATYDAVASWSAALGPLRADTRFDPLSLTLSQYHMLEGSASWNRSWRADFAGPEAREGRFVREGLGVTAVLPTGTEIKGEVGAEVFIRRSAPSDVAAAVGRAVSEGLSSVGIPHSWRDIGRIVGAVAERLKARVIDVAGTDIIEASVYLRLSVVEGAAGFGVRLSLAVDGVAIPSLLAWVVRNAVPLLEYGGPNPFFLMEHPPPQDVAEHTWLRVVASFFAQAPSILDFVHLSGSVSVGARIAPNLAAIGRFLGRNWGRPEVGFGLAIDAQVKFGPLGEDYLVSILTGTVVFA